MNNHNKILLGLVWKFLERFSSQIITFCISIFLARLLLPSDYGLIAIVNVFIVIANVFTVNGFSSALIQNKNTDDLDFSTMFYCSFIISIIIYIILFFTAPIIGSFFKEPRLALILQVLLLQLPIASFNSILNSIVSRKMIFKYSFFSNVFGNIISGILGIWFAINGYGVWSLVIQNLSGLIIGTIILSFILKWYPKWEFSIDRAKVLMNYGFKIFLTDFLDTVFNQIGTFIIGKVYSPKCLAYYNRGSQFPQLITNNIDGTISSVLFPAMSNEQDKKESLKIITRKSITTTTFLTAPMMLGIFAIAKPLVQLLLTNKWLPSVPFVRLMCLDGLFMTISIANIQAIKASGRSDIILKLEILEKIIYAFVLIIGATKGVITFAVCQVIYDWIGLLINLSPNKALLDYSIKEQFKDIYPSFLNSIIMCIIISVIGVQFNNLFIKLLFQILLGFLIYTLLSLFDKKSPIYYFIKKIKNLNIIIR